jgi:hypothetical protein
MDDTEMTFLDTLLESNDEFQDGDLGGAAFTGRLGYHRYYDNDSAKKDLAAAYEAALHDAVDEVFGMLWIDEDTVLEQHDEVTAETIADTFRRQADDLVGRAVVEKLAEELHWKLEDHRDALNEDGDDQEDGQ